MKHCINAILFLVILSLLTSCKEDKNDEPSSVCDGTVIISADEYQSAPNALLTIMDVSIEDDCMVIQFGSSGCDGSTWVLQLIDSGAVAESFPPQRSLRLSLRNNEACDAYFTKSISFDIRKLQTEGNSVILHLDEYDQTILYEY